MNDFYCKHGYYGDGCPACQQEKASFVYAVLGEVRTDNTGGFMAKLDLNVIKITIENKLIERTDVLERTLKAVLKRWKYDADQGDGIHETDFRLYNRAMKLVDKDYEPE